MFAQNIKRLALLVIVGLAISGVYLYARPVPAVGPLSQIVLPPKTEPVAMAWPATGQAAYGAAGYGLLAAHNANSAVSIASIAKIITAMAVLQQKPLQLGQTGPAIPLDATDLGYFNYYYLNDGSTAKVEVGESISEYQALQAMLLPSANNMADSLARWSFGSTAAYTTYANKLIRDLALNHTTVGSPSGFADDTTSTADDLVKIGLLAMQDPVIAQIVGQPSANLPVAGDIKNVNWLLGSDGVVGIKTGNTDKAGGCYLFAAKRQIQGQTITVVGAILGAPDLNTAISEARPLLASGDTGFAQVTALHKNQAVGTYQAPWGGSATAVVAHDVKLLAWKASQIKIINNLQPVTAPAAAGAQVGTIGAKANKVSASSSIVLSQALPGPSFSWRIFH